MRSVSKQEERVDGIAMHGDALLLVEVLQMSLFITYQEVLCAPIGQGEQIDDPMDLVWLPDGLEQGERREAIRHAQ